MKVLGFIATFLFNKVPGAGTDDKKGKCNFSFPLPAIK